MKKSGLSPGASGLGAGPDGGGNSAFLALPQDGAHRAGLLPPDEESQGMVKAEGRKLQLPGEGNRKLKQLVADPDTCLVED